MTSAVRDRKGQGARDSTNTPASVLAECFRMQAEGASTAQIAAATGVSRDVQYINRRIYDQSLPLLTEQRFPLEPLRAKARRKYGEMLDDQDRQGIEEIIDQTGLTADEVKRVMWSHANDLTVRWELADRLACGFGYHPCEVWGESWID